MKSSGVTTLNKIIESNFNSNKNEGNSTNYNNENNQKYCRKDSFEEFKSNFLKNEKLSLDSTQII